VILAVAISVPPGVLALLFVDDLLYSGIRDPGVLFAEYVEIKHGWVIAEFFARSYCPFRRDTRRAVDWHLVGHEKAD